MNQSNLIVAESAISVDLLVYLSYLFIHLYVPHLLSMGDANSDNNEKNERIHIRATE